MSKFKLLLFILVTAALLKSCAKPFDEVDASLTPSLGLPLLDAKIQLKEVVDGLKAFSFVTVNADGSYQLKYSTTLPFSNSFNLFENMPVVQIPPVDTIMSVPFPSSAGSKIELVELKRGRFRFSFGAFQENLSVTFSLPQFTKNGVPFSKTFPVAARGRVTETIDLSGYRIAPDANANIKLVYDARNALNERIKLFLPGNFYEFSDFANKYVEGYFGQQVLASYKDSISLSYFKDLNFAGEIKFYESKINFSIANSFGVPFYLKLNQADLFSSSGAKVSMTGPLNDGFELSYPSLTQKGQFVNTLVSYNKSNSNVVSLVNLFPSKIVYKIDGLLNRDSGSKKVVGFMSDTSSLKVKMEIDIPVVLSAKNFTSEDAFAIDFAKLAEVKSVEMNVIAENGLPLEVTLQGYFVNASNQRVDSLFSGPKLILPGAPVNADGLPTAKANGLTSIVVDAAKFDKIRTCKKLIVKYTFASSANGSVPVKLNQLQEVAIKIGVKAKVDF